MVSKKVLSAVVLVLIVSSALGVFVLLPRSTSNVTSTTSSASLSTSNETTTSTTPLSNASSTLSTSTALLPPTFYVATDGNDSWTGTLSSPNTAGTDGPFASIAQAQSTVGELLLDQPSLITPIVVEIEGGTYFLSSPLNFTSADSGLAAEPVVYEAAPGATVTISGGAPIKGWTETTQNVWKASVSGLQPFEQLWVNGERVYPPRTTIDSYLYFVGPVYSNSRSSNCSIQVGTKYECFDRFRFHAGDLNSTYYNINQVQIDDFECWTVPRLRLSSVNTFNDTAFLTGDTSKVQNCHGFIAGHRYLVENTREDLKQPGQWYLDRPNSQLLYVAAPGENPNNENFIAPQLNQLLVAKNLSYVDFEGLTFSNSNWVVPQQGWPSPQGEELSSGSAVPAALSFTDSSNIILDHCNVSHIGNYAISFAGTGDFEPTPSVPYSNQVINGDIYDAGAGGVIVGRAPSPSDTDSSVAQYVMIENNEISGIGRFLPGANGIYVLNAHNNLISHNDIHDIYSNAISVGGTYGYNIHLPQLAYDNIVQFNLVYEINQGVAEDGGAIYTASGIAQGNRILNNVVHDVVAYINSTINGYGGWGIYFDSTSQNVLAENNLVYRTSFPSIHQNDGFNNTVTNNILAFGKYGIIDRTHNNASSLIVTHNIMLWDMNSLQGSVQRGVWTCNGTCTSQFLFSDNLYWYFGGQVTFITTNGYNPNPISHTLAQWQALGEDQGSTVANPMFADPAYPADNFTMPSNSPALAIGFVPFDPGQAGRLSASGPGAPVVPAAFPLNLLNPSTGF